MSTRDGQPPAVQAVCALQYLRSFASLLCTWLPCPQPPFKLFKLYSHREMRRRVGLFVTTL